MGKLKRTDHLSRLVPPLRHPVLESVVRCFGEDSISNGSSIGSWDGEGSSEDREDVSPEGEKGLDHRVVWREDERSEETGQIETFDPGGKVCLDTNHSQGR